MEYLNESRAEMLKERLREAESESQRLQIVKQLFKEIRQNSESVINKMEDGVTIDNFDEVKASLANEFNRAVKKLMNGLKDVKISQSEWANIISELKRKEAISQDADVQTIRIKRNRDKVEVLNFDEFPIMDSVKVRNLSDLQQYFDELADKIGQSLNIEPPQVTVEAPKVDVPAPIVNVPEIDLSSLKDYLKKVNQSLTNIRNNRSSNPLAVRLSDGQEFIDRLTEIVDQQKQQLVGFPGKVTLHKNSQVSVKAPQSIGNGAKDVTTAGTAETLSSSSVGCKEVIICAKDTNTGKIYYGGSTVSSTSGAFLYPGASVALKISDLKDVYIDSAVNGEGVQYSYVS